MFLEKTEGALSSQEMREALAAIDLNFDKQTSLMEFLIYIFQVGGRASCRASTSCLRSRTARRSYPGGARVPAACGRNKVMTSHGPRSL